MFASLAQEYDNTITVERQKIINPQDWLYVLEIYEDIWTICVAIR